MCDRHFKFSQAYDVDFDEWSDESGCRIYSVVGTTKFLVRLPGVISRRHPALLSTLYGSQQRKQGDTKEDMAWWLDGLIGAVAFLLCLLNLLIRLPEWIYLDIYRQSPSEILGWWKRQRHETRAIWHTVLIQARWSTLSLSLVDIIPVYAINKSMQTRQATWNTCDSDVSDIGCPAGHFCNLSPVAALGCVPSCQIKGTRQERIHKAQTQQRKHRHTEMRLIAAFWISSPSP